MSVDDDSQRVENGKQDQRKGLSPFLVKQIEQARLQPGFAEREVAWAGVIGNLNPEDLTALLALKEYQAHIDGLTGELSYTGFVNHAEQALETIAQLKTEREPDNKMPILLYCDADGLKRTNDTKGFGREAGNKLLVEIAAACKGSVGKGDIVGRVGADEFAVLFVDSDKDTVVAAYEGIQARLSELRNEGEIPEWSGASFGAVELIEGQTIEELLLSADAAMKEAKNAKTSQAGERGGHIEGLIYQTAGGETKKIHQDL